MKDSFFDEKNSESLEGTKTFVLFEFPPKSPTFESVVSVERSQIMHM